MTRHMYGSVRSVKRTDRRRSPYGFPELLMIRVGSDLCFGMASETAPGQASMPAFGVGSGKGGNQDAETNDDAERAAEG